MVLLAPLGDSAIIELDGTKEYIIKTNAFMFKSGSINVSLSPNGFGLGNGSFSHSSIVGQGTLGIATECGIVSLSLEPGQECIIDPKY